MAVLRLHGSVQTVSTETAKQNAACTHVYPRDMQLPSWYGSAKKRQHDMGGFMLGNMIGTRKQGNDRQHGRPERGDDSGMTEGGNGCGDLSAMHFSKQNAVAF